MPIRIGIIANPQFAHGRNFLRGAIRYIEEQRPEVKIDVFTHDYPKSKTLIDRYDGLISTTDLTDIQHLITDINVVWVGHRPHYSTTPEFNLDEIAIGKHAAKTFETCGVASYGYYECLPNQNEITKTISELRLQGYRLGIQESSTPLFSPKVSAYTSESQGELAHWLEKLPKPAGIFTFNDLEALKLAEVCRFQRISIPRDLMILGVDNDQLLCSLNQPKISSIDPQMQQLSRNAMHHLLQCIESATPSERPITTPLPVVALRETTGHSSCPHPIIQEALKTIQHCAPSTTSSEDIAAAIGISLRSLELHFKQQLSITIQQTILEELLKGVKQRLRTTNHTIESICADINWEPSALQHAFKRVLGQTPGNYRAQFRPNPPAGVPHRSPPMERNLTIGIVTTLTTHAHHELLRGAQDYCQTDANVHLALRIAKRIATQPETTLGTNTQQAFANYDGFIATREVDIPVEILESKPIVTLDRQLNQPHGLSFHVDNYAAGKLAAEYFLQKGYTEFAYICYAAPTTNYEDDQRAEDRLNGFQQTLKKSKIHESHIRKSIFSNRDKLDAWVATLPPKTAIYSFNDTLAIILLQSCDHLKRLVPDDISILSTDNDPFQCNLSEPRISSVDINFRTAGYRMIEALITAIQQHSSSNEAHNQIQVRHVIERESTKALGTNDPDVIAAVQYIRQNYGSDIGVNDIVAATTLSRRSLEARFKTILDSSILQKLQTVRLHTAKDLLTSTTLSVKELAPRCGFKHERHFCQMFKKQAGETPLAYRNSRSLA